MVILASGPSLTEAQVEQVGAAWVAGHVKAIAINTTFRMASWADVLYGCDGAWWRGHPEAAGFHGLKVTQDHDELGRSAQQRTTAMNLGLRMLRCDVDARGRSKPLGLSTVPGTIRTGSNSGYQALNLAVQLGAARVLLLGFDAKLGPAGQTHWHGDHPKGIHRPSPFRQFIAAFTSAVADLQALGVDVLNCTPGSALECFPRADLAEVL